MSPGLSNYLNALRFVAALIVLLSHFAYARFSGGDWSWLRTLNLGSDAVVVFFVMSGFVIALTASRKDKDFSTFLFARATRLMSVALPALLLGWGLDRWGASLAPDAYYQPFYAPLPLWEALLRGLTFSNEWSGLATRMGSNGPFWSLSYEVAYYLLFGVAIYMSGARRAALLLAGTLLFGLNILLLMPAWLMGVWLYHKLASGWQTTRALSHVLSWAPVVLYGFALSVNLPDYLKVAVQPDLASHSLRFSDEYLWNGLLGALVCLHLAGISSLLKFTKPARSAATWTWLSGASFSLYLAHYPLLQFISAAAPEIGQAGLLIVTLIGCFVFAELFERPLHLWRQALRQLPGLRRLAPSS